MQEVELERLSNWNSVIRWTNTAVNKHRVKVALQFVQMFNHLSWHRVIFSANRIHYFCNVHDSNVRT